MSDRFFEGTRVGRNELITRLSIGGMAELYLARLDGLGGFQKLVALKTILPGATHPAGCSRPATQVDELGA
jgi:hypothetical protein